MEAIQKNRIGRVLELMREKNVDAVLVSACYLGNLDAWLLGKEGMPLHLPYNRNNLCFVDRDGAVTEYCAREPHPTDWGKFPLITEAELGLGGRRLGLVNPTYLKKVVRDDLQAKYDLEFVDISDEFHLLKTKKTPEEIEGVERAAALFDRVFTAIPLLLTGERTEREIAVALRNRLREMNAECEDLQTSSMLTMTSSRDGERAASEPIEWPGRRVTYGDRINIQVNGFMPGGFAAALGRTYVLGEPSEETAGYWNLAVQAQSLIAEKAKPGATVAQLMTAFRTEILEPAGLVPDTGNQIYGIGTGVFEAPRNVDSTRDLPLEEGMTLVIAPKIVPEGKDPYCCCDVFVVTADGARRLSRTGRGLCVLD
ncbi:MAG: aminopeptidase P family protein [Oscillospiraceae bacterium]|nr:aminopeptidase P family protein [Oscillospiraceae bacterium]